MDRETFKIKDSFNKFNYSGLNNFPSISKFKKHQKIDFKKYKSIIKKYFTIYFYEVYFLNFDIYFFLGGKITKTRCGNKIASQKTKDGKLITINPSVGLLWYNRPSSRWWFSLSIKKQAGSTNMLPLIEKEWKAENDVGMLPHYGKKIQEIRKENKIFQ